MSKSFPLQKIKLVLLLIMVSNFIFSQNYTWHEFNAKYVDGPKFMEREKPREEVIQMIERQLKEDTQRNFVKGIIWCNINLAMQNWKVGKTDKSITYLDAAKKLADADNGIDNFTLAKIHIEYVQVYRILKMYEAGIKETITSEKYGKKIENEGRKVRFLSYLYQNRGNLYYSLNKYDSALVYFKKANRSFETITYLSSIGEMYMNEIKNRDSAEAYLRKALILYEKGGTNVNPTQISSLYNYYAHLYMSDGKYEQAIPYLEKSLNFAKKESSNDWLILLYQDLYDSYKKTGDKEKEKLYLEKYSSLKDSIDDLRATSPDLILKKIEKDTKDEAEKSKNKIILYSVIGSGSILLIALYFYFENKKKHNKIVETENLIEQKISETKILEKKITNLPEELIQMVKRNDPTFLTKFQEAYPEFCEKIKEIDPRITVDSLKFCALLRLNISTKEIAEYTFVTIRAVQIRKGRIRKKFNIPSDIDLNLWMANLTN